MYRQCQRYITSPICGEKILVYNIGEDGKPIFTKQFLKLWQLLTYTGPYAQREDGGIVETFPLPDNSLSKLIGIGQSVDPTSTVRLILFSNQTQNGPILDINPNIPFLLTTYDASVNYKISWRIKPNREKICNKTKIGFYSSANFEFEIDNHLELISGNKGVCIFTENSGSFICEMIKNIYVAVDQDVLVDVDIKVVIPNERLYPPRSFTRYIKIYDDDCEKHEIPVYTLNPVSQEVGLKEASEGFRHIARLIREYLEKTSLSIILFNNMGTISNRLAPIEFTNLDNIFGFNISSIGTSSYPDFATDRYFGIQQGLKLTPVTGKFPKISFTIDVFYDLGNLVNAEVTIQRMDNGSIWHYHNQLDPLTGNIIGSARTQYQQPTTMSGSFILPERSEDFNITVYYSGFPPGPLQASEGTVYRNVTVEYISIPPS